MNIEEFILARLDEKEEYLKRHIKEDPIALMRAMVPIDICREVVDMHRNWPILLEKNDPADLKLDMEKMLDSNTIAYRVQRTMEFITQQEYRKRFGSEPPTAPMLRAMARKWRTHDDFDIDWMEI